MGAVFPIYTGTRGRTGNAFNCDSFTPACQFPFPYSGLNDVNRRDSTVPCGPLSVPWDCNREWVQTFYQCGGPCMDSYAVAAVDESIWIARAKAGDQEAFEAIFQLYE